MNTKLDIYNFSKTHTERRITITSETDLTVGGVLAFLDQLDGPTQSPILGSVKEDLKIQSEDADLQGTAIGGRDARLNRFVISDDELTQMSRLSRDVWPRYLEYRYKFQTYPRRLIVPDFPLVVSIEPTSVCNLRCQMCFQSDDSFNMDKSFLGSMKFDLYKLIIDEMEANGCDSVVFASRGEPTLHPKFPEMLAYATPRVLDVKVTTNATRLTEKMCHGLLEANPSQMVFSVDSADPKQYEEIRIGAKFEKVLANIIRFRDIREKHYPDSRTVTRVSATMFRDDQDPEHIHNFWSQYVDQVAIHGAWPLWDSYNAPLSEVTDPCKFFWERLYIWYDGTCSPCDIDYKAKIEMGKVGAGVGIKDVWHSAQVQRLREQHKTGQKNCITPCNRCSGTA